MNPVKLVLALVPFVVYGLLLQVLAPGPSALFSAAAAIAVVLSDLHGGVKAVPLAGAAILTVFALIGFLGGAGLQPFLTAYAHGLATMVLAAYILVTAGSAPFTAQYARQTVPQQFWHSPVFARTNRVISAAWGLAVAAMAFAHLLAAALTAADGQLPVITALLSWGIPVVAIVSAYHFTQNTAASAGSSAASTSH